jgi:deoxycytidylate deaminase
MVGLGATNMESAIDPEIVRRDQATELQAPVPEQFRPEDAELVFGLVYAVGTHIEPVVDALKDYIRRFGYIPQEIRISKYITDHLNIKVDDKSEADRVESLIKGGNQICLETKRKDFLALAAAAKIAESREQENDGSPKPRPRTAYIIRSLKRPKEAATLRNIYHPGFYLISVFASREDRIKYLVDRKGMLNERAKRIIEIDEREEHEYGQQTRDTFHRADVFVQEPTELKRFLDLLFGEPFTTPTRDEYAMFMAASASLRSAQFGRQVGAAITTQGGDVISLGCNEVPKAGGGLYWSDDNVRCRDHERTPPVDSNDEAKREIEEEVLSSFTGAVETALNKAIGAVGENLNTSKLKEVFNQELKLKPGTLRSTKLFDITEYGRAVHAEMDALLNCSRAGISPVGGTLFTTAFPCHNCTRHAIAAGIKRVVYIEPYPKSRAMQLHGDAIRLGKNQRDGEKEIPFVPFVGIGPRRFFDLFSMDLSAGYPLERKIDGTKATWTEIKNLGPRTPMLPTSYLDREQLAVREENLAVRLVEEDSNGRSEKV